MQGGYEAIIIWAVSRDVFYMHFLKFTSNTQHAGKAADSQWLKYYYYYNADDF